MAARLVQNISDDYLSCPICLQRFNDPRKLTCDHTFCSHCLQQHIHNTAGRNHNSLSIKCPLCRTEIVHQLHGSDAGDWITHFPVDNLILDLVATLSNHERQLSPVENRRNKCQVHLKLYLNIYCLHHLVLICSKCAEEGHSKGKCKSVAVDDAFDQLKPRIEDLRRQLYSQVSVLKYLHFIVSEQSIIGKL